MSLINDALRRAKETQQQTPPPPSPELPFRPVEPTQQIARRDLGLLLPVALAGVALLALLLAWVLTHPRGSATPFEVNARTARVPQAASPASAPPAQPAPAPTLTAPPPPKPAPLRLQAIIFNPRRPSAMIGGKTLFVGDKVGDLRIVAIGKDSATLAGGGQTNVLSLAE